MELVGLAERIEQATANERELFEDAFRAAFPKPERIWITDSTGDWTPEYTAWIECKNRFYDFLEVGAFLDAAMLLVDLVSAKWGRPANLVIAAAYGSAYIVPNDGESYGINDPLKGEARVEGDGISIQRAARAVTSACLRAIAAKEEGK